MASDNRQYILGLDLGTHTIRAVHGAFDPASAQLSIIGTASGPARGFRRGHLLDAEDAVSAVSAVLEQVERMTGVEADTIAVNIGGTHLTSILSKGTVATARPDGEIGEADIARAIESARAVSIPANREVLHVIPRAFTVDGQGGIPDPRGTVGVRLEVDACLVHSSSSVVRGMQRLIAQAGLGDALLVAAPLAAAEAVLSPKQKELGSVIVDIGGATTSVGIYEEGGPIHVAVIPIGGGHITNDLAIGLRSSIETAERVKRLHAQASWTGGEHSEVIDLAKITPEETARVDKLEVIRIVEARVEEIFEHVRGELKAAGKLGQLPAGTILVGGGSQLPGIVEMAKKSLGLPASLGTTEGVQTVIDRLSDPSFATAVGLVKFAQKQGLYKPGRLQALWTGGRMVQWKRWLQSLLP